MPAAAGTCYCRIELPFSRSHSSLDGAACNTWCAWKQRPEGARPTWCVSAPPPSCRRHYRRLSAARVSVSVCLCVCLCVCVCACRARRGEIIINKTSVLFLFLSSPSKQYFRRSNVCQFSSSVFLWVFVVKRVSQSTLHVLIPGVSVHAYTFTTRTRTTTTTTTILLLRYYY